MCRAPSFLGFWVLATCSLAACASDEKPPPSVQEEVVGDGEDDTLDGSMPDDGSSLRGDAALAAECDLSGTWIVMHETINLALGVEQLSTNWSYHVFERDGDDFIITGGTDCGYVVRGSTDVSLGDDTLEAMADQSTMAYGTRARFRANERGKCELEMDRIYSIRGANRERFLDSHWQVGDPDLDLDELELPADAAGGMEDWDFDGHEAITQLTGLGDRYTAQIDWHSLHGEVEPGLDQFGGEGVIIADYDARESVSQQTPAILSTSSTPMPPGVGYFARVDDELDTSPDTFDALVAVCKQVQELAIEKFGDPKAP